MTCKEWLEICANVAAILTPIVGIFLWLIYQWGFYQKKMKLEAYLKTEREKGGDKGQRTLMHLMIKVGLTESEILQASFKSRHIKRLEINDSTTHLTEEILFQYID
jgi:hypothetical protein